MKPYPNSVCRDCAYPVRRVKDIGMNTVWYGKCDVCGDGKAVSPPGDYGWPDFEGFKKVKMRKGYIWD